MLAVKSLFLGGDGLRVGRARTVPLVGGLAMIVLALASYPDLALELAGVMVGRLSTIVGAAGTILLAVATVDFLFHRVLPYVARALAVTPIAPRWRSDAAVALLAAGLATASFTLQGRLSAQAGTPSAERPTAAPTQATPTSAPAAVVEGKFDLPGQPMDMAMTGPRDGYLTLAEGRIVRFRLPTTPGDGIELIVVHDGLDNPRGVAVHEDTLFVVELGSLPCDPYVPRCGGRILNPDDEKAGEEAIIRSARGRVLRMPISEAGSVGPARRVFGDLPVVSDDHAPNGLTVGPDGSIYLAIGNLDVIWRQPERAVGLTPHPELMGTVVRFNASAAEPEIFATGLRNVYEVAFDEQGRMWAVDNDGWAQKGWRAEELLQIKLATDYGFPTFGTFGPSSRSDPAVWLYDGFGTAGIGWLTGLPTGPALAIGSCGKLSVLKPTTEMVNSGHWAEGLRPGDQRDVLTGLPGCVTSVVDLGDGDVLLAIYGWDGKGRLYVVHLDADRV